MAQMMEIRVPDIGDFSDVPVIEVLVAVGEKVSAEQSLLTLESDKATMEVPAPADGVITELLVGLNDTVSEGDLVARLEAVEAAADDAGTAANPETDQEVESETDSKAAAVDTKSASAAKDSAAEPATPAAAPQRKTVEVTVPDIGEFDGVPVIEILVSAGDTVAAEQSLVTLESDKATMEVPAPGPGTIVELKVALNDSVSEGDVVAILDMEVIAETAEEPAQSAAAPASAPTPAAPAAPIPPAPPAAGQRQSPPVPLSAENLMPGRVPYATPAIRAFARELGVNLSMVRGTGRGGRIIREDVAGFVKTTLAGGTPSAAPGLEVAPPPKIDFSKFGETETQALSRIKKISGKNLHRNWVTIPHVTHNDLADSTEMEAFRQQHKGAAKEQGYSLTPLAFLIKSTVAALQAFPNFNASLDAEGENLILKRYYHIGIAVDTPDGLVVPVLRDCDQKSVTELAKELGAVSQRARDGKLKPADWQGASFSISSLGGIGGVSFSPIINSPEVGILGVSRARMEPVWDGEAFQPRLMLPLSLSYDHRVIDGAQAARFTRAMADHIENTENLSLK